MLPIPAAPAAASTYPSASAGSSSLLPSLFGMGQNTGGDGDSGTNYGASSSYPDAFGSTLGFVGGLVGAKWSKKSAANQLKKMIKFQRELAQNQIQWRVADARKAGIHPLAALGAQLYQGSVSPVGAPELSGSMAEMGQNLSRAVDAVMNRRERAEQQAREARLADMQETLLASQIEESQSRTQLNQAHALASDAQRINYVRGASVNAQPKIPSMPRVQSRGKFNVGTIGGDRISKVVPDRIMGRMIGPNGEKIWAPTKETAERGQNMWGLLEAYGYASEAFKALKENAERYGRFMRRYHNSRGGNIYE